jgi:hypothetical protein
MTLTATINGQPATIEIDRAALLEIARRERGALNTTEAAIFLGCCEQTVRNLGAKGEITRTSYGTFVVSSLLTHLEKEGK